MQILCGKNVPHTLPCLLIFSRAYFRRYDLHVWLHGIASRQCDFAICQAIMAKTPPGIFRQLFVSVGAGSWQRQHLPFAPGYDEPGCSPVVPRIRKASPPPQGSQARR